MKMSMSEPLKLSSPISVTHASGGRFRGGESRQHLSTSLRIRTPAGQQQHTEHRASSNKDIGPIETLEHATTEAPPASLELLLGAHTVYEALGSEERGALEWRQLLEPLDAPASPVALSIRQDLGHSFLHKLDQCSILDQ